MRETTAHTGAFNEYYLMGDKRTLMLLASNHDVTEQTMKRWSIEFNWQGRIAQRDINASRKLIEQVDKEVVNARADYRKMIKEWLGDIRLEKGYLTKAYATAKKKLDSGELKIDSIKDLTDLAKAMQGMYREGQSLAKLDLLMMGEADSKVDGTVTLIDVLRAGRAQKEE